ncbi:MAG TPA: alpha/beta hydrolase [Planctomycetota bacterium]|jgi:acetyl esterase/lipase|nr:alpha/beta hydrolase [Planctomycetota bacterium]
MTTRKLIQFILTGAYLLLASVSAFASPVWAGQADTPPAATPPAGTSAVAAPTQADVAYGKDSSHRLDFYKAAGTATKPGPTPVVIYFHGGGFVSGDKTDCKKDAWLSAYLAHGISVVSANYRFISKHPFPAPLEDGVRAVQYVRSRAAEWGIDPKRVALEGHSAGGCIAVWIATRDEQAKPDSADPVEKESSRVCAALGHGAQTTLDPAVILKEVGGNPKIHPSLQYIYNTTDGKPLDEKEKQARVKDASALEQVSKDDPPLWLGYSSELKADPLPETAEMNLSIHNAKFGKLMKDRYTAAGLECVFQYKGGPAVDNELTFLAKILSPATSK